MMAKAKEEVSRFRRAMSSLWRFLQGLEYAGSGYHLDQIGHAMDRIRALERDVADLKARGPTEG